MTLEEQLLRGAARATGLDVQRSRLNDPIHRDFLINGEGVRNPGQKSYPWNPLTDDGDALRLAVKLKLLITYHMDSVAAMVEFDATDPDPHAATRRAIVLAAAASA